MVVEINGTQSETRFLDEDGKTIRGRKSRLELSRSGGVKVFKSFQGESPNIGGAFVYEVRQHRLTLVSGLLQNEESLPEIKLRHFFRMKPGETDSGAIEEVPTSLTFDIENGLVTDVYGAEFRHFYGTESIAKQVDWLLSLPTPITHLKLNSDGLIEANVFEEVSRLDQLQDLWIESYAKYTDKEVQPLARMPHLKELTFKESIVTPGACREILNVKSLKILRIPQLSEELQAEMNSHRPDLSAHGHNNYEP